MGKRLLFWLLWCSVFHLTARVSSSSLIKGVMEDVVDPYVLPHLKKIPAIHRIPYIDRVPYIGAHAVLSFYPTPQLPTDIPGQTEIVTTSYVDSPLVSNAFYRLDDSSRCLIDCDQMPPKLRSTVLQGWASARPHHLLAPYQKNSNQINSWLRGEKDRYTQKPWSEDPEDDPRVVDVSRTCLAVTHFPSFLPKREPPVVFRGTFEAMPFTVGAQFCAKQFLSTSTELYVSWKFMATTNKAALFTIQDLVGNARDMVAVTNGRTGKVEAEYEILLPPCTCLEVTSVTRPSDHSNYARALEVFGYPKWRSDQYARMVRGESEPGRVSKAPTRFEVLVTLQTIHPHVKLPPSYYKAVREGMQDPKHLALNEWIEAQSDHTPKQGPINTL
uniref:Uncharacterized protein n=1 Tax=Chromera velia CCMP2878 TaxID=1169474 RepID=A0A0G4HX95_9ALVE|eukprot:Cvel_9203.t1-p1 / transcript=Cvel_9203.t1 / gene=Cvel_9203 / organism=Chromera_velia_CCMP2878 / gene_product=hypothetical protein / transcript_product=hypothetical protein / location=Cvel_scaffold524:59262-60416(+) / protein_length=385 / sequence_SO=supercontig / SO=protein_coding / is_pseudo=false